MNKWREKTLIAKKIFLKWIGIVKSKFYDWIDRYGKINEHNALIPRDHWLEPEEKQRIIDFHYRNPLNGYRRLCYMMIDEDIVAVSPSTVRNVLKAAGLMDKKSIVPSKKGQGFNQPNCAHMHWHTDISYLNINGTFYYFSSILDGYSRSILHWEIKESMTEKDVEILIEATKEKYPEAFKNGKGPRVISDNGPQYAARDFKEYVRISGMTHVRTAPYYPQSNGKIESFHKTIKSECIRPVTPQNIEHAKKIVTEYVDTYNNKRLHSAIGYVTPTTKISGLEQQVFDKRDEKLKQARDLRAKKRHEIRVNQLLEANTLN